MFGDQFPYVHVVADPQLGVLAIGGTHGLITAGSLRAWDMRAKKPLWDVKEIDGIKLGRSDKNQIEVVGHNVYVAHEKILFCLDLATGQRKWSHTFAERVDCSIKLALSDPHPPGTHGAILVTAGEGTFLLALDRESGALLWEQKELEAVSLVSAENRGRTFVWSGYDQVQIFRPESSTPLFTLQQDLEPGTVQNGVLLSVVGADSVVGDAPEQGIYGLDAAAGRQAFFVQVADVEPLCIPCAVDHHVFAIRKDRRGIYAGPDGQSVGSPVARTAVGGLLPGNHTLGVFVYGIEGESSRRFLGLDPETLAIRFDSGPLGALSEHDPDPKDYLDYLATDGASFVFVDGKKLWEDVELRSVETSTGRPLWTHRFEKYFTHEFRDGVLIVRGKEMLEVKRPSNGEVIASLRLND